LVEKAWWITACLNPVDLNPGVNAVYPDFLQELENIGLKTVLRQSVQFKDDAGQWG
jgi:hypothetical protein